MSALKIFTTLAIIAMVPPCGGGLVRFDRLSPSSLVTRSLFLSFFSD
jgi:hypothetical protein